ncbi:MAG: hypothetical protein ABII09_08940 [Planctomycetota bacterium]
MLDEKPQVNIPETGSVGPSSFEKKAEEKFRHIDMLIYAVVVAIVITAISALISVGAIVIDQLHFNNQTYREFADLKAGNIELIKKISDIENKVDSLNQHIIVNQQEPNKCITEKK